MDGALGDALPILMRKLFEQLIILHQQRPARACRERILVVGNRIAGGRGHDFRFIGHDDICVPVICAPIQSPIQRLLKYLFPVVMIGNTYGNASASLCGRRGAHG